MTKTLRGTAVLLALALVAASPVQDKSELRYAFKQGAKHVLKLTHAVSVKLEKVPDLLQGVLSEDPIDLKFEGVLDVEVAELKADGSAVLKAAWRTAKAKGHFTTNDVDFQYDAAKKGDAPKAAPKKEGDDPALQGFLDIQEQLAKMVKEPVTFTADARGRLSVQGAGGGRPEILDGLFNTLNGLMGPLPEKAVGPGDAWKEQVKMALPGMGSTVDLKMTAENSVKAGEGGALVVESKYAVEQKGDAPGDPQGLNLKLKTSGGGTGSLTFLPKEGISKAVRTALKMKLHAVVPNPGGGDDLDLKADVKLEMGHELGQ